MYIKILHLNLCTMGYLQRTILKKYHLTYLFNKNLYVAQFIMTTNINFCTKYHLWAIEILKKGIIDSYLEGFEL